MQNLKISNYQSLPRQKSHISNGPDPDSDPIDKSTHWNDEEWELVGGLVNEFVALMIKSQVSDFIDWLREEGIIESVEEGEKEEDNLY